MPKAATVAERERGGKQARRYREGAGGRASKVSEGDSATGGEHLEVGKVIPFQLAAQLPSRKLCPPPQNFTPGSCNQPKKIVAFTDFV